MRVQKSLYSSYIAGHEWIAEAQSMDGLFRFYCIFPEGEEKEVLGRFKGFCSTSATQIRYKPIRYEQYQANQYQFAEELEARKTASSLPGHQER